MISLPVPARQFVRLVMLGGAAVSYYAIIGHRVSDTWNLLLMIILGCQMAAVKVRFRFAGEMCTLSMSFPFIFAALLHFGLREGIIVAVFCALSQCLFNSLQKPPLYRVLFSASTLALTVAITGLVYTLCKGLLPMPVVNISAVALMAGAATFWLVNNGLVSGAVSLSAQKAFLPVWRANLRWSLANFVLGGLAALIIVYIFQAAGIGIFVMICPLLYLAHYIYKLIIVKMAYSK